MSDASSAVDAWLAAAIAAAEKRGLPELKPLLEGLATATRLLRRAPFNEDARGPIAAAEPSSKR